MMKMIYAMICKNEVIDIIHGRTTEPEWPPTPDGFVITAVPCDDAVEIGMLYNSVTEEFYMPEPEPFEEPEPDPVMKKLNSIETRLDVLTSDSITAENVATAILEGVNEV